MLIHNFSVAKTLSSSTEDFYINFNAESVE